MRLGTDAIGRAVEIDDPLHPWWIVGLQGRGKSTAIGRIVEQAAAQNLGAIVLDIKNGELARDIAGRTRYPDKIVYVAPGIDAFALNPLAGPPEIVVDSVLDAFTRTGEVQASFTQLSRHLSMAVRLVVRQPGGGTLHDVYDALTDPSARRKMLQADLPIRLRKVWEEFEAQSNKKTGDTSREQRTAVASTLGLLDKYLMDDPLSTILGQRDNTLDLAALLDDGAIICCNLAENVPPRQVRLLGNLLMASVISAALARPPRPDNPFWLVASDEFDQLAGDFFSYSIEKLRAARIVPIMSHQSTAQLSDRLLAAVSGADIKLFFQIAPADVAPMRSKVVRDAAVVNELERLPHYTAMLSVEDAAPQVEWLPKLPDATRWTRVDLPDWWAPFDEHQLTRVRRQAPQEHFHVTLPTPTPTPPPHPPRSEPGETLPVGVDRASSGPRSVDQSAAVPLAPERPARRSSVLRPARTGRQPDHGRNGQG